MDKKTCFVVMGFGEKMDYRNSRKVDLDIVYKKVVKEVFSKKEDFELIRGDEVSGSEIIDVSMYKLLLHADLVIADITTMNENAIYELGVRHALKPYSTIIMAQKTDYIPFDLSHSRVLMYDDYGIYLDEAEAEKIKTKLEDYINEAEKEKVDSPLYTYLPNIQPPILSKEDTDKLIQEIKEKEETVFSIVRMAEELKNKNDFLKSFEEWKKLKGEIANKDYILQQMALTRYKSKEPNETIALLEALNIINELNPRESLDLETLGIAGAIYKRLYRINENYDYLDVAIELYRKGYLVKKDYYNGENYSNCLLFKTQRKGILNEEKNYLRFESKNVCSEIVEIIKKDIEEDESNNWMYASLATCYFILGNEIEFEKYKKIFFRHTEVEWERDTFEENLNLVKECL